MTCLALHAFHACRTFAGSTLFVVVHVHGGLFLRMIGRVA